MPTTINTSDLTITTRELITLGGNQYDSKHTKIIPNIKEVTKRIITVPTGSTPYSAATSVVDDGIEILKMDDTLTSGPYKVADIRYCRITNLDDTNFITLQLVNSSGQRSAHKLDFGSTYVVGFDMTSGSISTHQANSANMVSSSNTIDFTSGSTTVATGGPTLDFVVPGTQISGSSHMPTGSVVTAVDTLGAVTSFTMSEAATLTGNNIETKFKIGLNNLSSIHAVADVENVDIEIFVATV
tara:strand:- start:170 stop:895 length:726 start_codon:yes stop_codon:yes gene_type:complete